MNFFVFEKMLKLFAGWFCHRDRCHLILARSIAIARFIIKLRSLLKLYQWSEKRILQNNTRMSGLQEPASSRKLTENGHELVSTRRGYNTASYSRTSHSLWSKSTHRLSRCSSYMSLSLSTAHRKQIRPMSACSIMVRFVDGLHVHRAAACARTVARTERT